MAHHAEHNINASAAAESLALAIPAWRSKRQQKSTTRGRFLGCMLGGAVGDALGAPVEFMERAEILRRFGPKGITHYAPAYGGVGTITDDTQMTLFTAEGLIRGWVRGCFKGITTSPASQPTLICAGCKPKVNVPNATLLLLPTNLAGYFNNASCIVVAHPATPVYQLYGQCVRLESQHITTARVVAVS